MKKRVKKGKRNWNVYIVSSVVIVLVLLVAGLVSLKPESGELVSGVESKESSGFLNNVFDFFGRIFGSGTETGYGYESIIPPIYEDEPFVYLGLDIGDECVDDLECKICSRCDYAPDDIQKKKKVCVPSPGLNEAEHPVNAMCDFKVSDSYCSEDSTELMRKITTTYCDGSGGCNIEVEKENKIRDCLLAFPEISNHCNIKGCLGGECVVDPWEFAGMNCRDFTGKKGRCVLTRGGDISLYIGNIIYSKCYPDSDYYVKIYFYLDREIGVDELHGKRNPFYRIKETKEIIKKLEELGLDTKHIELTLDGGYVFGIGFFKVPLEDLISLQKDLDKIGKNRVDIMSPGF